jgi:predicted anti-sigma-YlaC factor YlaD
VVRVLDRLAEERAAAIEEHLLVCEQCRDQLAQVDQCVQAMRASLRRL